MPPSCDNGNTTPTPVPDRRNTRKHQPAPPNHATEPRHRTAPPNRATEPRHRTPPPNRATEPRHRTTPPNRATEPRHRTAPPNHVTEPRHRTTSPNHATEPRHRTTSPNRATEPRHRTTNTPRRAVTGQKKPPGTHNGRHITPTNHCPPETAATSGQIPRPASSTRPRQDDKKGDPAGSPFTHTHTARNAPGHCRTQPPKPANA